jgi:hypothetical protein
VVGTILVVGIASMKLWGSNLAKKNTRLKRKNLMEDECGSWRTRTS